MPTSPTPDAPRACATSRPPSTPSSRTPWASSARPGIAYGIALDGELVHAGGCGARDLDSGSAPDADTAFRICSMTKSFMAMTVLSLRDEGRLDIDAPLGDVVAELAPLAEAGPDAPPVTVRQLLTMDAGLPQDDPWADRLMAHDREWVTETLFSRGATRSRAPGTFFEYSNYSWAALGRVVATVTGQRHQDVVRERVLDPLSLSSTVWSAGDLPAQRIATGYRPAGEGFTAEVPLADGGDFAALGGLYSTVRDLARWSGVFLDAEPPRDAPEGAPVSRATLREMQRARSAFAPGVEWQSLAEPPGVIAGGYGYGLMIWHERDGQKHVGHPGGLPGYGTLMRWVPELGLSAILLANVTYAKCEMPLRRALQLVAREAALPKRIIRADPGLLAARDAVDGLVARWDDGAAGAPVLAQRRSRRAPGGAARGARGAGRASRGARARRRVRARGRAARSLAPARRARPRRPRHHDGADRAAARPDARRRVGAAARRPARDARDRSRRRRPTNRASRRSARCSPPRSTLRRRSAASGSPRRSTARSATPLPVAGDGETTTTLRLPSDRGAVDLELELDAGSGRLARVVLRPAAP